VILALSASGLASCGRSSLSHIILVLKANHRSHRRTIFSHPPSPCFTTMSAAKPPPSLEDQMASLAAQMEKLAAAVAATKGDSAKITKISDSLVTLQGNQGQLIVAVNRLQSEKIGNTVTEKGSSSTGQAAPAGTGNTIAHAARSATSYFS
jgi:hypothetical protein